MLCGNRSVKFIHGNIKGHVTCGIEGGCIHVFNVWFCRCVGQVELKKN